MKVIKTEIAGQVYVVKPEEFEGIVIPELIPMIEDMVLGDEFCSEIKIRVCKMKEEKFDTLPEFEGW